MRQVRSEILGLGKLLQDAAPKRSLEIGTADGGTLFLLCTFCAPLVRNKGMIAFHDITVNKANAVCEVEKFWTELKQRYEFQEFIESPDQGWGGIGVIFKP